MPITSSEQDFCAARNLPEDICTNSLGYCPSSPQERPARVVIGYSRERCKDGLERTSLHRSPSLLPLGPPTSCSHPFTYKSSEQPPCLRGREAGKVEGVSFAFICVPKCTFPSCFYVSSVLIRKQPDLVCLLRGN